MCCVSLRLFNTLSWTVTKRTQYVVISSVGREYCSLEVFEAECLRNEVILMESAMYGRMRAGRCAVREYGPIGCGSSVMAIVDGRCSGRRSCRIPLPDRDMQAVSGCPAQATSHLEAAYSCLPGERNLRIYTRFKRIVYDMMDYTLKTCVDIGTLLQ